MKSGDLLSYKQFFLLGSRKEISFNLPKRQIFLGGDENGLLCLQFSKRKIESMRL